MNSPMASLNNSWMTSLPPTFASYSSSRIFSRRACSSGLLSLFRAIVKPPALCFYSILLWRFTQLWGWPHPFTAFPRHSVKTGGNRKSAHFGDTLPGIVQAFCLLCGGAVTVSLPKSERRMIMRLAYPISCGVDVHKTFFVATIITTTNSIFSKYQ